jgi:curved DNA-binding protein CbpA
MQYFKDCKSMDDIKRIYRELAKKFHPDHGGSDKDMIELTRQYDQMMKYGPNDDLYFKDREAWREQQFQTGRETFHGKYGGYGGYQYKTNANMRQEYYNQSKDPRLADYERMKDQYERQKKAYQHVCNELNNVGIMIKSLQIENENFKKKLKKQKRQLDKLKNMPKNAKTNKSSKRSSISL